MLNTWQLKKLVGQWLADLNYPFRPVSKSGESFMFRMEHAGRHGNRINVFKPRRESGLLCAASVCPFSGRQRDVFLRLKARDKREFNAGIGRAFESLPPVDRAYIGWDGPAGDQTMIAVIESVIFREADMCKDDLNRRIVDIAAAGDLMDEWIADALNPDCYDLMPPPEEKDPRLRDSTSKMPV